MMIEIIISAPVFWLPKILHLDMRSSVLFAFCLWTVSAFTLVPAPDSVSFPQMHKTSAGSHQSRLAALQTEVVNAAEPYVLEFLGTTGGLSSAEFICASETYEKIFVVDPAGRSILAFNLKASGLQAAGNITIPQNYSPKTLGPNACYVKHGVLLVAVAFEGDAVVENGSSASCCPQHLPAFLCDDNTGVS
eukprot:g20509.t1